MSSTVSTHRHTHIWLVHGTWARHQLPKFNIISTKRKRLSRWYETDSNFKSRLDAELLCNGIRATYKSFIWSGANSIVHREKAAKELADSIVDYSDREPYIQQIIIAHSHGGNIAIRALSHLKEHKNKVAIATLATPFLEVRSISIGNFDKIVSTTMWQTVLSSNIWWVYSKIPHIERYLSFDIFYAIIVAIAIIIVTLDVLRYHRGRKRGVPPKSLFLEMITAQPLSDRQDVPILCIRAPNDEAALTLAAGSLGNLIYRYVSKWLFYLYLIVGILTFLLNFPFYNTDSSELAAIVICYEAIYKLDLYNEGEYPTDACKEVLGSIAKFTLFMWWFITALITASLALVVICRSFFGFELVRRSLKCDTSTYSSPDTNKCTEVVTVGYLKRGLMRHAIYESNDCILCISDWANRIIHK